MIDAIHRIVQAVDVPVTADVESGYGSGSIRDVTETVQAVIAAGAVGVNLEDSPGRDGEPLLTPAAHAERIRAARQAALAVEGDLVINARTDVYLFQVGAPETRLDATIRRANLYRDAGADCIFVPGVVDAETITALARAIDGPVNIMATPEAPSIPELGRLGVARVSVGSALVQAALATARQAARELLEDGTYRVLHGGIPFSEANGMFFSVDDPL